jgi:hypothetical protein
MFSHLRPKGVEIWTKKGASKKSRTDWKRPKPIDDKDIDLSENPELISEGLAVVGGRNDKEAEYDEYYYIDKQGEQAIPEKYALASHFFKGLAHIKIKSTTEKNIDRSEAKGSFACIDVTGKKVFSYTNEG